MSANSSSSLNSSFDLASNNGTSSTTCDVISIPVCITKVILIVPLAVIILYLGYQRWRKQGGRSAASHCDVFTYHLVVMELFGVLGIAFSLCGVYTGFKGATKVGRILLAVPYSGETFFHILTCVERYLAIAHPHTYMGLRNARAVCVRNILIACVWLLSFAWMAAVSLYFPKFPTILILTMIVASLVTVSFCSLYALCALIRPGPGEGGQGKERVDQSKQRAFLTIIVILGVLWFWFAGLLVAFAVQASPNLSQSVKCRVASRASWLDLACNLVLPLLYLQRAEKLSFFFCKKGNDKPRITK